MYCHFGCNLIHILIIFPESLSINQRKKMARISSFHLHIHFYVLHISLLPSNSTISVHIYLSRFLVFSSLFIFFNVITSLFLFILLPSSIFLFVFINKSSFSLLIQTSFRWIIPDFEKNSLSYFLGIYQIVFLVIFNFILSFLSNDSLKQFYIQSQLILNTTHEFNVN